MYPIRRMHKMHGVPREKPVIKGTRSTHGKPWNILIFFLNDRQPFEQCVKIIPHQIIQVKLDFRHLTFRSTAILRHAL
ncbi:Uncharacterized protein TCM_042588 [Theobroma cacao]|uniref:Uncharacterized protein n=1 Tax=Theobroma cacao TaxID=3641 RepID=A0A061FMG4_THECC|nr:Uncharacterized protein TCM_042588 [Theobroma cacao]